MDLFPWNNYVKTTIGVNTGLNYATEIEAEERQRSTPGHRASNVLQNFSPEITFALPEIPNYEIVLTLMEMSQVQPQMALREVPVEFEPALWHCGVAVASPCLGVNPAVARR